MSVDMASCRVFLLLLAVGLTASSWLALAFLPAVCEGPACQSPAEPEVPPLTIFVSVAAYRDRECKGTLQVFTCLC